TRVVSRIQRIFKVEVPLRTIFERPTISQLAEALEMTQRPTVPTLEPELTSLPRDGVTSFPLSFGQQRLWVLDRLQPNTAAYNIPVVFRVRGALNVQALEKALNAVVERHEVLRTHFTAVNGEPRQIIAPRQSIRLSFKDLRGLPQSQRETRAIEGARQEIKQTFDLNRGPVLRAVLVRVDDEDHILALTVHHIAFDAWSAGILVRELQVSYSAFLAGSIPELAALPLQYADYAAWQRTSVQSQNLADRITYWQRKLAGAPNGVQLPTDRPRPSVQSFRGESHTMTIPPQVAAGLHQLGRDHGVTLFMTLVAALN